MYAHAARAALGGTDVTAEYWFLRRDAGTRIEVPLTAQVEQAYREALTVLVDGIAGGLFPQRPPAQDGSA